MSRRKPGLWAIFGVPIILGSLSLVGLVGALVGDGVWDMAGGGLLAMTVVAIAWAWATRAAPGRPHQKPPNP